MLWLRGLNWDSTYVENVDLFWQEIWWFIIITIQYRSPSCNSYNGVSKNDTLNALWKRSYIIYKKLNQSTRFLFKRSLCLTCWYNHFAIDQKSREFTHYSYQKIETRDPLKKLDLNIYSFFLIYKIVLKWLQKRDNHESNNILTMVVCYSPCLRVCKKESQGDASGTTL